MKGIDSIVFYRRGVYESAPYMASNNAIDMTN